MIVLRRNRMNTHAPIYNAPVFLHIYLYIALNINNNNKKCTSYIQNKFNAILSYASCRPVTSLTSYAKSLKYT